MKDLQEDDILGSVRDRLGRYEEAPSNEVWNKITSQKRKRMIWPIWATAAVVVGTFLVYSLKFDDASKTVEQPTIKKESTTAKKESNEIQQPTYKQPVTQEATAVVVEESLSKGLLSGPTKISTEAPSRIAQQPETQDPKPITKDSKPETKDSRPETTTPIKLKPDSVSKAEVVPPYKKPHSKFQLYLAVTPSLSFQKIIPGTNDNLIIQGLANRSPLSMKRFGFGIDAGLQREVSRIFGFYGGLSFYRQQQQITYSYYDKDAEVTRVGDSWTFEINRPLHDKTFDYTMTNLGARAGLLITLKGEKLKHKFGAGLAYTRGFAKAEGSYNNSQSGYLAYQVFYRNEFKINDRYSWYVEPTFTYSFISKEKLDEPFRLKPYRAGISGGMLYRFKR